MSTEANKQLVQHTFAALFNTGNLAIADELVSADFVNHDAPPHVPGGPEGLRQVVQEQIHLRRFANGKGVEHRAVRDDLGLLRQMGAIPERP